MVKYLENFSKKLNKSIRYFSYILLLLSILVFIVQTVENINLKMRLRFDSIGIENLITNYGLTMQFFIAFIAIFTLWTYLKRILLSENRIQQTEIELKLLSENNKFNSYIKHREEFYKHFESESIFFQLSQIANTSHRSILRQIHKDFYGGTFKEFSNRITDRLYHRGNDINHFIQKAGLNGGDIDLKLFHSFRHKGGLWIEGYYFQDRYLKIPIDATGIRAKAKINLKISDSKLDIFEELIQRIANIKMVYNINNYIGDFEGTTFAKDPKQFKKIDLNNIVNIIYNYEFINDL